MCCTVKGQHGNGHDHLLDLKNETVPIRDLVSGIVNGWEPAQIDAKNDNPQGGGEPAIVTMGAVIANAVFDAVGVRVLQLPLSPENVKKELDKI